MKYILSSLILALLLINAACSSSKHSTTTPSTPDAKATEQPVENTKYAVAKAIYDSKCTTCHDSKKLSHYSDESWKSIMAEMAPKARLTDTETQAVMEYVLDNNGQ